MGTGYTRNDTSNNIADGNVINASDLDGEFDAIQAAFNATTGHSHDGTTGEGPQIGTGGIADNAVTLGTKTSGNYVAAGAVSGVGLSGSASSEGATFTVTSNATSANTASTIVARDASGNFSAGQISGTSFASSGDMTFGDNDKAVFGAGSDLQIYHDGSNSYISDASGTGNLKILTNTLQIKNSADTEIGAKFIEDGAVTLYHNNAEKLATTSSGIDVTGTVTADGLTVDGDTASNGNLTITTSSNTMLDLVDTSASFRPSIRFMKDDGGVAQLHMLRDDGGELDVKRGTSSLNQARFGSNGDVSLYADDGTTQGLFWDASTQRLGLGNTAPEANMHISAGDASIAPSPLANTLFIENNGDAGITIASGTTSQGAIRFADSGGNGRGLIKYDHNGDYMGVAVNGSERLRITSDGSVGIGTSSPSDKLHVEGDIRVNNAIESANNLNLEAENGALRFYTGSGSPTERARLDTSGNFLLGKTSASVANDGIQLEASGTLGVTRTNDDVAIFNRKSSDGNIAVFRKDNTTVGSIGTSGGHMWFGCDDVGMLFRTNESIRPYNPSTQSERDAAIDLGVSSVRFKRGYFSATVFAAGVGGVSDENTYVNFPGSDVMQFYTGGSERARLTSGGNFLLGQTSTANPAGTTSTTGVGFEPSGYVSANRNGGVSAIFGRISSDGELVRFTRTGSAVGSVSVTTSGTTYNTTSDLRLKENIEPLVATDKLMAMNPVSYNWKADPDGPRSMGFIAQEMQKVMPEAVSASDDEDAMMSMDYGRITPILVSALQDAHRKIEQLEQRIADMEAK